MHEVGWRAGAGERPDGHDELLAGDGEVARLARQLDWSRTDFGPPERWPQHLRTLVAACLDSRFPIYLFWGPRFAAFYNDAYLPILGRKHPQALGRPTRETWPEIWHVIEPMLESALQGARATFVEDQRLDIDRQGFLEESYFTFSYSPVRDASGRVDGVFCAVAETTDRVLGARRASTLRALAEHTASTGTPEETFARAAEVLEQNPGDVPFARFYVVERHERRVRLVAGVGEAAGLPAEVRLDAGSDEADPFALARAARSGQEAVVALAGPTRSALVLPLHVAGHGGAVGLAVLGVSPRRALDGAYRAFLHGLADALCRTLGRAQALAYERQRAETLAALDRAKTAFFGNISHELRTPLTLLLGPLEDARARVQDGQARGALEMAHRNARRLGRLVDALLDFSRLEAGRAEPRFAPVDLGALTAELAEPFRCLMEKGGLRFTVDVPRGGEPAWVDPALWETVVLNLLSNAFKYTLEGEVAVALRREPAGWALEVRDSGVGIPADALPHLFERFYRVREARSRTAEGTGVGLALVQELVQLHGGSVEAASAPGVGSTFTVRLPAGAAHLPPERCGPAPAPRPRSHAAAAFVGEALRWLPDAPGAEGRDEPAGGAGARPRERILLADDNADMREYLESLLALHWRVEAVADGQAALEAARREAPDLVLTDVMMPRLDGLELLQALRASPATRRVPVLLLSARAGEDATVEGLEAGADDYLEKPFSSRELLARVRTHLALARARSEAGRSARQVEQLQGQLELTRAVAAGMGEGLAVLDHDLRIQFLNPAAEALLGWTTAEVFGREIHETLHGQHPDGSAFPREVCPVNQAARRGEGLKAVEDVLLTKDGRHVPVEITTAPLCLGGEVIGMVGTFRDISARLQGQAELRRLAAQLSEVEDAERRRLAYDLHDSIGQTLSVIKLHVEAGGGEVHPGTLELIDGLIRQIRGMTFDLHPAMLDDLGLVPTLRRYAEQFLARTNLQVTVSESGARVMLPRDVRAYLFRAIKELLNNAAKHAKASEVVIGVHWLSDGVRVVVDDDGQGFDVEAALDPRRRRGLGLAGIRERLAALGGRFDVESRPGEGTRIRLEVRT